MNLFESNNSPRNEQQNKTKLFSKLKLIPIFISHNFAFECTLQQIKQELCNKKVTMTMISSKY